MYSLFFTSSGVIAGSSEFPVLSEWSIDRYMKSGGQPHYLHQSLICRQVNCPFLFQFQFDTQRKETFVQNQVRAIFTAYSACRTTWCSQQECIPPPQKKRKNRSPSITFARMEPTKSWCSVVSKSVGPLDWLDHTSKQYGRSGCQKFCLDIQLAPPKLALISLLPTSH